MLQRAAADVKQQAHHAQQHHQQRVDGQHLHFGLFHELLRHVDGGIHQLGSHRGDRGGGLGHAVERYCGAFRQLRGLLEYVEQARLYGKDCHCLAHSATEATMPARA